MAHDARTLPISPRPRVRHPGCSATFKPGTVQHFREANSGKKPSCTSLHVLRELPWAPRGPRRRPKQRGNSTVRRRLVWLEQSVAQAIVFVRMYPSRHFRSQHRRPGRPCSGLVTCAGTVPADAAWLLRGGTWRFSRRSFPGDQEPGVPKSHRQMPTISTYSQARDRLPHSRLAPPISKVTAPDCTRQMSRVAAIEPITTRNTASSELSRVRRSVRIVRFRMPMAIEKNAPTAPAPAANQRVQIVGNSPAAEPCAQKG